MIYEVFEDRDVPGQWRVEGFDMDNDGEWLCAVFAGARAEARAREYHWLMGAL